MRKNLFILLLTVCIAGCSETDRKGNGKIVSLSPAATEIVLALDGKSALAGRSSACTMPEAADIPVVGDMGMPFAEALLVSGAKIVITDSVAPGKSWEQLRKCGVKQVVLPADKLDDLPANVRTVGKITGKDAQAEKLAGELTGKLQQLRQNPPARKFRTLVVVGLPPAVTCGGDTFLNEALQLAGAENIAATAGKRYFQLSMEYILNSDPEIIISFMPRQMTENYFSRREFRNMSAVRRRMIFCLASDRFCRLSPRLPDEIVGLRSLLSGNISQ